MWECMCICMYTLYCCDDSRVLSMYYVSMYYLCIYVFVQIRALVQEE